MLFILPSLDAPIGRLHHMDSKQIIDNNDLKKEKKNYKTDLALLQSWYFYCVTAGRGFVFIFPFLAANGGMEKTLSSVWSVSRTRLVFCSNYSFINELQRH